MTVYFVPIAQFISIGVKFLKNIPKQTHGKINFKLEQKALFSE